MSFTNGMLVSVIITLHVLHDVGSMLPEDSTVPFVCLGEAHDRVCEGVCLGEAHERVVHPSLLGNGQHIRTRLLYMHDCKNNTADTRLYGALYWLLHSRV